MSDNPPLDLYTEEGELSEDPDQPVPDPDQPVSEEQNYRDTMQGIRSFMGWSHIPELDSTASTSDDNPFAGPKTVTPGKVSVKMPTEDWLCRKLAKLNLTLVEGYPSRGSEAGGLAKDVFLRPARTQSKWYGLHSDPKAESSQISSWNIDASKLNSSYSRRAKYTGLSSTPPASHRISQETLRRWERSARETSVICNQAASFNRCLFKIQQNMKDQLKILKAENKGKGSSKASAAAEELTYLMDFNSSITQAAAKSMEHLSEFVFVTMGNLTLVRRDAYLSHLRTGIKPDTLTALRSAPLHISTLFPDSVIKRAEEDIAQFESKGHTGGSHNKGRYHPYERQDKRSVNRDSRSEKPAWKTIGRKQFKRGRGRTTTSSRQASRINDNYCVTKLQNRLLAGSIPQTINTGLDLNVKLPVASHVHSAPGDSQKRELSPGSAGCHYKNCKLKPEKCFLCHSILLYSTCNNCQKCCTKSACRGKTSKLLENLAGSGTRPKSSSDPKRGLHPSLPDSAKAHKVTHGCQLLCQSSQEQLPAGGITSAHSQKNAVELVRHQTSQGFFNRLFLVPKPNNKWRPILDLSKLNLFLKAEKFKMETPETIRTSLQQGEWVTSIDFRDACFHIPIQEQSRKYLSFHVQGQTYQFKALPFGLSTAPLEFTVIAKEVKLMASHKGIRIHQYLDDWLVRAKSHQACLQHTQSLVKICQKLGSLVNLEKSELVPNRSSIL